MVSPAPERWSPTEGIVWRTEIAGHGISSPVIVGNRLYLTTAIRSQRRTLRRLACDFLIGFLAILGVPALVIQRWKLRIPHGSNDGFSASHRLVHSVDCAIFIGVAVTVLVFATLMATGPKAVDVGLNNLRDVGAEFARWLGRHQTNLWFLDWDEGTRHNTWVISSAAALMSLALIPFLFPTSSTIRVGGAITLLIGVALAKVHVPWAVAYGTRFPTGALIVLYSPVVALAIWHVLAGITQVRREKFRGMTSRGARLISSIPALMSAAIFVSPNLFYQREMVTRRVVCLDTASGNEIWHSDVFTTPPETKSPINSHATPTPSVVEDIIVAAFGPGIAAVNVHGRFLWSKTFPTWVESSIYGAGSSPVTDGRTVLVSFDGEYEARQRSRVIAYSLENGRELWSHFPQFAHDGYATPVVYDDGGRKLLVALTSRTLVGYDIASGAIAWRLRIPVSTPIPSPVVDSGRLYVTGGGGGDGYTAAYQLRQNRAPAELWASRQSPPDVSSPVLYKERLFTISSTGVMVCYDAESGEIIWRHRVGSGPGVFYASLVAADDKIYAVRSNGTTYVIAAEDKFRLISESSLPEEIFASPAFGAGCLFLRTDSALYCIGNRG